MKPFLFGLLLLVSPLAAQESPTPAKAIEVVPAEPEAFDLVRVQIADGVRIGVINKEFNSVDVVQCENLLVFTGPPGKYLLVGFDANGGFIQQTITVKGETPPPPPPVPPTPPAPPDIDNANGYGLKAYQLAVETGDREGALALAKIWSESADKLLAAEVDEQGAVDYIQQQSNLRVLKKTLWVPWARGMEEVFDAKAKAGELKDSLSYLRAYREVAKAVAVFGASNG